MTKSNEIDLSILIVNWNTAQLLERCLDSIARTQSDHPELRIETIVVDNASKDASVEQVSRFHPRVKLIVNDTNQGFARANNQAFQASQGKYLLLLNPDTELVENALRRLVDFMEDHPEAGAAGPLIVDHQGEVQDSCYPLPSLGRELWRLFHLDGLREVASYRLSKWDPSVAREVDVLQGACIILRRSALPNSSQVLSEQYFIYSEDVDLCYRLQQRGWKNFWVPESRIVHYGGQSTRQMPTPMFLQLYRAKIEFFRLHRGVWAARCYKMILAAASVPRILVAPLLGTVSRHKEYFTLSKHYWLLLRTLAHL